MFSFENVVRHAQNLFTKSNTRVLSSNNSYKKNFHRAPLSSRIFTAISIIARHLSKYPAPLGLTLSWTFGSLSFLALTIQIVSGLFLTMHYVPDVEYAFDSVEHIMRDVQYGHAVRYVHANGASFYFVCVYCHMFRSLYYRTFLKNVLTWQVGVVILLLSMAAAFLGYVLPWGQMSFWGATVITNLFSVIPVAGGDIVTSMWGGFGVGGPTLNRFYTLHFAIPLIIFALVMLHILLLHDTGSSTPQNSGTVLDKGTFGGLFIIKDVYLISQGLFIFCLFLILGPNVLNHPDNYNPADAMQTPAHIVPEWYFLPFYAVLRAIPNKAAGVIAMAGAILFFFFLPTFGSGQAFKVKDTKKFEKYEQTVFWLFTLNALVLGYIGGMAIEYPYSEIAIVCFYLYFGLGYFISARERLAEQTGQLAGGYDHLVDHKAAAKNNIRKIGSKIGRVRQRRVPLIAHGSRRYVGSIAIKHATVSGNTGNKYSPKKKENYSLAINYEGNLRLRGIKTLQIYLKGF